MSGFSSRTCFVHLSREAVALCLECRHSFCRECVVDHDGRLICAACLVRLQTPRAKEHGRLRAFLQTGGVALALLLSWVVFYIAGHALLIAEPSHHSFAGEGMTVEEMNKPGRQEGRR